MEFIWNKVKIISPINLLLFLTVAKTRYPVWIEILSQVLVTIPKYYYEIFLKSTFFDQIFFVISNEKIIFLSYRDNPRSQSCCTIFQFDVILLSWEIPKTHYLPSKLMINCKRTLSSCIWKNHNENSFLQGVGAIKHIYAVSNIHHFSRTNHKYTIIQIKMVILINAIIRPCRN